MKRPEFRAGLLHPRYWPTWAGFGLWYTLVQLPFRWQLALGRGLGRLMGRLAKRRRQISERNLQLCFPEQSAAERQALLTRSMEAIGIAVFETGIAWFWPRWRLQRLHQTEGLEHLHAARDRGEGVILLAFHFTHVDLGGKLLGLSYSIDGTYRPHNNPVYDYIQHRGRQRLTQNGVAMPRGDVRAMVKALRAGRAVWYAPDQDYGPQHSVFVPFFGVPAATVTATSTLARLGRACVIPFVQQRKADGSGYLVKIYPPLDGFPSRDEAADALRINRFAEARIREQPEQYLWAHRRFKTRPPGEPSLYPLD